MGTTGFHSEWHVLSQQFHVFRRRVTIFLCSFFVGAPVPEARARTMACPHALATLSEPHVALTILDNALGCVTAAQLVQLMSSRFHFVVLGRASTSAAHSCRMHARFHVAHGTGQTSSCCCEFE